MLPVENGMNIISILYTGSSKRNHMHYTLLMEMRENIFSAALGDFFYVYIV